MVFAGGGTGGHVYPNLAVARALEIEARAAGEALAVLYVGVRGRVDETIVPGEGIAFRAISAGPLRVGSPLAFARNMGRLALGVLQSLSILRRFRPDVVFATGGYASVPVGVAARILRTPLVVYLPDVTPGWAVRLLSRLATKMTTTSERALEHLPRDKTTVVGYPVRAGFWDIDRTSARQRLGVAAGERLLLVTAGSLGARAINETMLAALPRLLDACVVVHVTGRDDEARARAVRDGLPEAARARYIVHGYMPDLPAAMVAADIVVARAGASALGEMPAAGVPSILVPGEYEGWSQAPNAEYMRAAGASVVLRNAELSRLGETVLGLLADEERLQRMREAARALARPGAARDIALIVMEAAA